MEPQDQAANELQLLTIDNVQRVCHYCSQSSYPSLLCRELDSSGRTLWLDYVCASCLESRLDERSLEYLRNLLASRQQDYKTFSSNTFHLYVTPGTEEHAHLQELIAWEAEDCQRFHCLKMKLATNWLKGIRNGVIGGLSPEMRNYLTFYGNDRSTVKKLRELAYSESSHALLAARLYLRARTRSLTSLDLRLVEQLFARVHSDKPEVELENV